MDSRDVDSGLRIVRTDQYDDPLAEFDQELNATPDPPNEESYSRARGARRSWASVAVVGGACAAFAAGAYLYGTYPAWLPADERSQASVTGPDESEVIVPSAPPVPVDRGSTPSTTVASPDSTAAARDEAPRVVEPMRGSPPRTSPARERATTQGRRPASATAAAAPASAVVTSAPAGDVESPSLSGQSLSGQWALNTRVESSSLERYEGLRLQYHLQLQQVGNRVTGSGYKLRENDRAVGTKTPIRLTGDVDGDRVVLTFQEQGTRRVSTGKLVLLRESGDVLRGRFSSDAAQSSGVVDARR